jgi:Rrf2 family iron-sulfur cluster assembly transcriptional regulator
MILGTKARYAVMAMVDLALHQRENPVCLADIAERQEISLAYLEQIFPRLKKQELVIPVRGPGGGYRLARAAEDISIGAIVGAVEESVEMTRCNMHEQQGCMTTKTRCLTHDLWDGLTQHIHRYLNAISLRDVCQRDVKNISDAIQDATNHCLTARTQVAEILDLRRMQAGAQH